MSRSVTRSGAVYGRSDEKDKEDALRRWMDNVGAAHEIETDPQPLVVTISEKNQSVTGMSMLAVTVTRPVNDDKKYACHLDLRSLRDGSKHEGRIMGYLPYPVESFSLNNSSKPIERIVVRVHVTSMRTGKFCSFHKFEWAR